MAFCQIYVTRRGPGFQKNFGRRGRVRGAHAEAREPIFGGSPGSASIHGSRLCAPSMSVQAKPVGRIIYLSLCRPAGDLSAVTRFGFGGGALAESDFGADTG